MQLSTIYIDGADFTDQHWKQIDAYRMEWNLAAASTTPADRPTAEQTVLDIYSKSDLEDPIIVWCQSPWQLLLTASVLPFLSRTKRWDEAQDLICARSSASTLWQLLWLNIKRQLPDGLPALRSNAPSLPPPAIEPFKSPIHQWGQATPPITWLAEREPCKYSPNRSLLPCPWVHPERTRDRPFMPSYYPKYSVDGEFSNARALLEFTPDCIFRQGNHAISNLPNYCHKQLLLGQNELLRTHICSSLKLNEECALAKGVLREITADHNLCGYDENENCWHQAWRIMRDYTWWGPWQCFYQPFCDFLLEEFQRDSFHPDTLQDLRLWNLLAKSASACVFFDGICLVGERPVLCKVNELYQLHSDYGPAVEFADGFRVYALQNRTMNREVVENPDSITVEQIESEQNSEVRRILIERYGQTRWLVDTGAEIIHEDEFGVLYRRTIEGEDPFVAVKVLNSTTEPVGMRRAYFLRVPPDITTAKAAVAWTFGMSESEYKPLIET